MISELTKKIFFDGVTLSVAQGTTEDFEIEIEDESTGKKYVPTASTKVVFGMKKNREDSDILVSKELTYNNELNVFLLQISPNDTKSLSCGRYFFDISLSESKDFFKQIIPTSILMITSSVAVNPA